MWLLLIIDVEHLVFEFRIYVELDAEQSDVRLSGRGVLYATERPIDLSAVDNFLPRSPTAYDRVDDRVFPEDV